MSAFVASYVVSLGAMSLAASCALTFFYIVRHLDPPGDPVSAHTPLVEAGSLQHALQEKVLA